MTDGLRDWHARFAAAAAPNAILLLGAGGEPGRLEGAADFLRSVAHCLPAEAGLQLYFAPVK